MSVLESHAVRAVSSISPVNALCDICSVRMAPFRFLSGVCVSLFIEPSISSPQSILTQGHTLTCVMSCADVPELHIHTNISLSSAYLWSSPNGIHICFYKIITKSIFWQNSSRGFLRGWLKMCTVFWGKSIFSYTPIVMQCKVMR